ncbi:ATPase, T2SS/T4P/T4SS family [Methanomethylovorans sp.]|uniref:ATPase, T2SS/T4P/T4SS family n=1 Tax=Methanomethylovorans sp. TaxID=2758717 RepID=UPI00351CAF23
MKNRIHFLLTGIGIRPNDRVQQDLRSPHSPDNDRTRTNLNQRIASITHPKKEIKNKECRYRIKKTRNTSAIIIDCGDCRGESTLNNPKCRSNIFQILLKETIAERLVLSNLYEREYDGTILQKIYTLARLEDHLRPYENIGTVSYNCTYNSKDTCKKSRKASIEQVINSAKASPVKAYEETERAIEQLKYEAEKATHPECDKCVGDFQETLYDIKRRMCPLLNNFLHEPDGTFDYEKNFQPYVRPLFSTSRIYTEPPVNTIFIECYDVQRDDGRKLPISIYEFTDKPEKLYVVNPAEYNMQPEELLLIESIRNRMIKHRPEDMNFADPALSREYFRRLCKRLLHEEIRDKQVVLAPSQLDMYSDLLAKYTTGLGILEDLLSDERVTDIYVNAPADKNPVNVVMNGEECTTNIFLSQEEMDSMVSRFRTISGRPFGEATPVLEMALKEYGVRVSVIGDPLSAKGMAYAFRKHAKTPWTLPKLINSGAITPLTAGLLSFMMDGHASVLIAGGVGAGKTSLLCAMLMEMPQKYRILTIEDTPEIPLEQLQKLGWKAQGLNAQSSIVKSSIEIEPSTALRASLRLGSSSLVIGEVRGPEVAMLYEAMQVGTAGNSVIGTIHGASTNAVYERIVHTLGVPPASFRATDAVIVCSNTRIAGSMATKRKVIQIAEVNEVWDPDNTYSVFSEILTFDASVNSLVPTDLLDRGQSALIRKIARKWGISVDEASKNIRIRASMKLKMAEYGRTDPSFLEAEMVSAANNIFWMFMEQEKEISGKPDMQRVYDRWCAWFKQIVATKDGEISFSAKDKTLYNGSLVEVAQGGHDA